MRLLLCFMLFTATLANAQTVSPTSRKAYRLDTGDIVGVLIDGVVGSFSHAKVNMPSDRHDILPSIGDPYVVLANGTLALPLVNPISVRGLTISQARKRIEQAYQDANIVSRPNRTYLSLMRKRTVNVTVMRTGWPYQSSVHKVRLPATQASVIAAASQAGLHSPDARIRVHQTRGSAILHVQPSYRLSPR